MPIGLIMLPSLDWCNDPKRKMCLTYLAQRQNKLSSYICYHLAIVWNNRFFEDGCFLLWTINVICRIMLWLSCHGISRGKRVMDSLDFKLLGYVLLSHQTLCLPSATLVICNTKLGRWMRTLQQVLKVSQGCATQNPWMGTSLMVNKEHPIIAGWQLLWCLTVV